MDDRVQAQLGERIKAVDRVLGIVVGRTPGKTIGNGLGDLGGVPIHGQGKHVRIRL